MTTSLDKSAAAEKLGKRLTGRIQSLCDALRIVADIEYSDDNAANLRSYCSLMDDIRTLVEAAVGRPVDINWHGNESFFDDVLCAICDAFDNYDAEYGDDFDVEYVESVHGIEVAIRDSLADASDSPAFIFSCVTMETAKAQAAATISNLLIER